MQQINLLNPALIKKTAWLNPNSLALLLGVLVLSLFGYAALEHHTLSQLEQSHLQLTKQIETTEKQLAEMRTIAASKNDVATQLKQIEAIEQKIMMQKEMIKAIGLNKNSQTPSYAEIFKAFSRQSVDGLWITGLSISQNTDMLSIKGRAVDANLLPTFIANLRHESALKGKTFTDLTMQKIDQRLTAGNQPASATSNPTTANTTIAAAKPTPLQTPPFMEFTLHSVIDKNAPTTANEKTAQARLDNTVDVDAALGLAMQGATH